MAAVSIHFSFASALLVLFSIVSLFDAACLACFQLLSKYLLIIGVAGYQLAAYCSVLMSSSCRFRVFLRRCVWYCFGALIIVA